MPPFTHLNDYTVCDLTLLHFNTQDRWTNTQKDVYMYTIIFTVMFGPTIVATLLFSRLVLKIKKWLRKPNVQVTQQPEPIIAQEPTPVGPTCRVYKLKHDMERVNVRNTYNHNVCYLLFCCLIS